MHSAPGNTCVLVMLFMSGFEGWRPSKVKSAVRASASGDVLSQEEGGSHIQATLEELQTRHVGCSFRS